MCEAAVYDERLTRRLSALQCVLSIPALLTFSEFY